MEDTSDKAAHQRSYDRNLGYARFWLGVGIAVLSLLFTFGYDLIFGDSGNAQPSAAAAGSMPDATAWLALLGLLALAFVCFLVATLFRYFYRRDNAALVRIARSNQNHNQKEEVTQ